MQIPVQTLVSTLIFLSCTGQENANEPFRRAKEGIIASCLTRNERAIDFYAFRWYNECAKTYRVNEEFVVENIIIRKITSSEVASAMALALEVFMQFEAPDYSPEGVETFKRDIVENPDYLEKARQGVCPIYGAFDGDRMVALIGMRSSKSHINLVFTKKEYQRKGIARAVFSHLLKDLMQENPALEELTLNSSPYGLPFYLSVGFVPLSEEQEMNGIRYTPMKYTIKK